MIKSIDQFFTVPNDDLTKDGSVDVMGFQKIWTHFGQQIFDYKLTTVSFDIRNYTVNLLHYYLLFSLNQKELENAKEKFGIYNTDYDVKAGLLIYLEDLLVYSLLKQRDREGIQIAGLLGSYNGQRKLNDISTPIILEANGENGILKRQIQLGVNGRYKGPFMSMGLIHRDLSKNKNGAWAEVEDVFNNWGEGKTLLEKLSLIIRRLLLSENEDYPTKYLDEVIDDNLLETYFQCFGIFKPNEVLADFWMHQIGINEGASLAIYEVLGQSEEVASSKEIIEKAKKAVLDPIEKEKLSKILKVEPLLTQCTYIFYLLTNPANSCLGDILPKVERIVKEMNLRDVEPVTKENERLKLLFDYVSQAKNNSGIDAKELIRQIVLYHEDIMTERNGGVWVELNIEEIKHLYTFIDRIPIERILDNSHWYHNYYLGALNAILHGLNLNENMQDEEL